MPRRGIFLQPLFIKRADRLAIGLGQRTAIGLLGEGQKLIQGALDQVRAEGLKVVAQCPFVKAFIGKNPAYQDLLKV